MAVRLGRLGMVLAALSDPAGLSDPRSLSRRITPGGNDGADGRRHYELIAGWYPHSSDIVFSAQIRIPASDLSAVLSRLS